MVWRLSAPLTRTRSRLAEFADHFHIEKRFQTLEEAIAWGEFDSATNVTPDRIHHATSLALIAAGKHVFCEKPLAENYADGAGDDGDRGSCGRRQHGQPRPIAMSLRCSAPAKWCWPASSARIRRTIEASYLQSWLVSRPGVTGARSRAGYGACRPVTVRTACSAMSASISSTSPPMAQRPISTMSLPA